MGETAAAEHAWHLTPPDYPLFHDAREFLQIGDFIIVLVSRGVDVVTEEEAPDVFVPHGA